MFAVLFMYPSKLQPDPSGLCTRNHFILIYKRDYDFARKRERIDIKVVRRASLIKEDTRQIGAREVAAEASSSILNIGERRTTEG